jgi:hypothetical protein
MAAAVISQDLDKKLAVALIVVLKMVEQHLN